MHYLHIMHTWRIPTGFERCTVVYIPIARWRWYSCCLNWNSVWDIVLYQALVMQISGKRISFVGKHYMNVARKHAMRLLIALGTHKIVCNYAVLCNCMFCASDSNRYISPGPGGLQGVRGPAYVAYVLSSSVLSLFVNIQIKHFRPSPKRYATDSLSDLF
jgi:hypothetical protein